MKQIGTVKILSPKVYASTPGGDPNENGVCVNPGTYPVFRDGNAIFWRMRGRRNAIEVTTNDLRHVSPDMFGMSFRDRPYGKPVTVDSARFSLEGFRKFLTTDNVARTMTFDIRLES